jgi:hypothetical protein
MIQRLMACVLGLACVIAILFLVVTQARGARTDTPPDESDPALVKSYMSMPCDAMRESYDFQYSRLVHLTGHILACHREAKEGSDYQYPLLMCLYVQMEWKEVYTHSQSVKKAWELMCNGDDSRKMPEYKIDF